MALAWKAGWVNALRGSNPLSSAIPLFTYLLKQLCSRAQFTFNDALIGEHLATCNLSHGGVSERPKERASKARVGATSPWVQIPPPPPVFVNLANPRSGIL